MSACEKCWRDAGGDPDEYRRLLATVRVPECTPEEQAGPDALWCTVCGRRTLHQHTGECMVDPRHGRIPPASPPPAATAPEPTIHLKGTPDPRTGEMLYAKAPPLKEALDPLRASPTEPLDGIARRVIREAKNMRAERDEMTEKRHVEIVRADAAEAEVARLAAASDHWNRRFSEEYERAQAAEAALAALREAVAEALRRSTLPITPTVTGLPASETECAAAIAKSARLVADHVVEPLRALASVERGANP